MKANKSGIYWIKTRERFPTPHISDWTLALYWEDDENSGWELMGTEIGLEPEMIAEIGPEVIAPDSPNE